MEKSESDLGASVVEFISRFRNIENELGELREQKKELVEEFKTRFDMKTMRLALKVAKAKSEVSHQFEFDQMLEILEKEFAVLP